MTIPNELRRSTPRPVTLTATGKAVTFLAYLLILVALTGGAWLYTKAGLDANRRARHAADAIATPGEIVAVQKQSGKDARWLMTYSFSVNDRMWQGRMTTRPPITVGRPVVVGYMPSDPGDNWVVGHEPATVPFWLGPALGVTGLAIAALLVWSIRRRIHLLSCGRGAVARVTDSRRVSRGPYGGHAQILRFEFTLLNGAAFKGRIEVRGKVPQVNTEFVIVYDPDHPKRAARYPMPLVSCVADFVR